MHRFILQINNLASFSKFLSLTDKEYVDVYFTNGGNFMVNNSPELFGYFPFKGTSNNLDEYVSCRVKRMLLLKLSVEGFLVFNVDNTSVVLDIIDTENVKTCSIRFARQQTNKEEYEYKVDVISRVTNDLFFHVSDLKGFCKVAKASRSVISVRNGIASASIGGRGRIYQTTGVGCSFSCIADRLSLLMSYSDNIFSIENFVGIMTRDMTVLVTKCNGISNEEFQLLEEAKSAYVCKIDLAALRAVLAGLDIKESMVTINLETKEALLSRDREQIAVPVKVWDVRKSADYHLESIQLPVELLKNVFVRLPNCTFQFSKKKYAMLFENDGIKFYI